MDETYMIGGRLIRHATIEDFPRMQEIFAYAREQMRKSGNPNQWGASGPGDEKILKDIEDHTSFIIEENGKVAGTFAFFVGEDPYYKVIENGSWLNDEPYAYIHRVASDGTMKGMFTTAFEFAKARAAEAGIRNIRIDTHHDNKTMQHVVTKHGFKECGIVHISGGRPRIAYQWREDLIL